MRWTGLAAKLLIFFWVLAISGCAVLVVNKAQVREAQAVIDYPPLGQFLNVDGRRVHYLVMGSGPDLVLIHGASGNMRDFLFKFAQRVSDRYRVILFDRPGMGYTDRTDPQFETAFSARAESPREQANLLRKASGMLGAERPIVLGHSYGGAVALAWALYYPDDLAALVNVAGASMPWPGTLGLLYNVTGSTLGGAVLPPLITAFAPDARIAEATRSIFAPNPAPDGYADYVGSSLTVRRDSFRANARQVNSLRPYTVEMAPLYAGIKIPVEIIHGDLDTTVPLEVHSQPLSELIPDARLTVLEGVGHMPHHVRPDAVADAIDRAAERAGLR